MESQSHPEMMSFGARWRAARPGCGCGRDVCPGCALTPRTVSVLQAELAWICDLAADDIAGLRIDRRSLDETVLARLPAVAAHWTIAMPRWLERFSRCVREYVDRLDRPGPVDPRSLAEEVALHMAFAAARAETDPDALLPPDLAEALPVLPGDYAWFRAEEAVPRSDNLRRLYQRGLVQVASPGEPLHPVSWFGRV